MIKPSEADEIGGRNDEDENNNEATYLIHSTKKSIQSTVNYGNNIKRSISTSSKSTVNNNKKSDDNKNLYQIYSAQLLNALNDKRSKFQLSASVYLLLLVNGLERFAYYGLICNYILYLNKQPLYWESYNASFILFIFLGKKLNLVFFSVFEFFSNVS